MCGIAAVFSYDARSKPVGRESVECLCARMVCRGPDGKGIWVSDDGRTILGHRRLAIIDLSERGCQPMTDSSGSVVISFNGEIYNYRQLRRELEAKGFVFRTDSDTEVLLNLYLDRGATMIEVLRGMFAFALWDQRRNGLLLARDPFGIKPLYFSDTGRAVAVASEVKALLQIEGVDTAVDPAGHVGFFLWGHVPEPHTLFRGIRALPPGSTLWIDAKGRQAKQHFNLNQILADDGGAGDESSEGVSQQLREALLDSVRHHLVADVEVGVFLSSGLDSAVLTALASEVGGRIRTVTLGFEEFRGTERDETPLANVIARQYGTQHETVWLSRRDFLAESDRIFDRMDQPTIDGVNSYFVAKAASAAGLKVALSGLGGDELFGGYPSFRQIPRLVSVAGRVPAAKGIGSFMRALSAPLLSKLTSPKYAGLIEYGSNIPGAYLLRRGLFLPWEIRNLFDADFARTGLQELAVSDQLESTVRGIRCTRLQISALEATHYMRSQLLRDTDWASMAHSVEVRVPLVDWKLWSTVGKLIRTTPGIDKQAMARTPALALPTDVIERPKTGFHVPIREWIGGNGNNSTQRGLRGWAQHVYQVAQAQG
jgi:asparagine synthase (glutamine-hydrolysing)